MGGETDSGRLRLMKTLSQSKPTEGIDCLWLSFNNPKDFEDAMAIGRRHKFPDSEIRIFIANRVHDGVFKRVDLRTGKRVKIKKAELEYQLVKFCVARQHVTNEN
jgi:hypothetical protein